ncbi:hypothetical protein K438DRAFT_1799990 [Mycena galopus ATCC 62051]|nr:hypothetical protein K438DRAFT_1799990 [Mycena galopus ATCC 62051]
MGATTASSDDAKPGSRSSRLCTETSPLDRRGGDIVSGSDNSAAQTVSRLNSSGFRPLHGTSKTTAPAGAVYQENVFLSRHGTLLTPGATPLKRTVELKSLLGNANSRLPPGALVSQQPRGQEPTSLEQAKLRARVEIDIMLHSNTCVEGGLFKGFIKLRIRPRMAKEPAVSVSDGKLRIIGFETVAGDHHEFFQHSAALSEVVSVLPRFYDSPPDSEGFYTAQEGLHKLVFEMQVPMGAVRRPKGPFHGSSGVAVRYIALASVKVKDEFNKRSIAHFYRDCQLWPRLNPSVILAPAQQPIQATISKGLSMGGNGEVHLTAALHRSTFIAGSTVNVNLSVKNETRKLIKSLTLTLYRSMVVFKRKLPRDSSSVVELDIDASRTTTTRKAVANSTLEMAQGFPRSHASTDGWWAGIPSGERLDFSHLLLIPPDALTLPRGVLIEVEYTIRVSLNARSLTTGVSVDLPIKLVNLLSLDPPPPPTFHMDPQSQTLSTKPLESVDANYSQALSGSYDCEDRGSDSSDAGDESDGGFQNSCTDDPPHEVQLGNLSMCDDAEDLVLHAIPMEPDPETPQASDSREPESHPDSPHLHLSRPSRPRGPSSFALRVQKKLELAATTRQLSASDCEEQTPAKPPPMVGLGLGLPAGSAISRVSGYEVASSSFLDDRYFGSDPIPQSNGAESSSSRPAGSRVLPKPPSIVGLPFRETPPNLSALGVATFLRRIEQHKPRRPPIASGMSSAGSVKDKIRELEERVRSAEGY